MPLVALHDDGTGADVLPLAAPPPGLPQAPPPPSLSPPATAAAAPASDLSSAVAVNVHGETLAQAEAAALDLVAGGMLGADALALHPLPPGTTTEQALAFLASLPQTTYQAGEPGGTVTGPPVGSSVDVGGTTDGTRELEAARKPAGVVEKWRDLVDVFKTDVPKQRHKVDSVAKSLVEVFK